MRNIATPIAELQASQQRAQIRKQLQDAKVISEEQKTLRLQQVDDEIATAESTFLSACENVRATDAPKQDQESQISDLTFAHTVTLAQLQDKRREVDALRTEESRAQLLADLGDKDQEFESQFGLQQLSEEDITQRTADRLAREQYLATDAYKDQRRQEYPPIEEQLDAFWKGGDAAEEMRQTILAVKAKYPKPEQA